MARRTEKHGGRADAGGYVYVLANPAMPGIVKIGRTSRSPELRRRELESASGVPMPFRLVCAVWSRDAAATEREVHRILGAHRVNDRREFFATTPESAAAAARKAAKATGAKFMRRVRNARPGMASSAFAWAATGAWKAGWTSILLNLLA